jgi:TP901 family phage tail tape measure protein
MANFLISGVIRFIDEASPNLRNVTLAMNDMQNRADRLKTGLDGIGDAFKAVAAAGALSGAGFGVAIARAADFEDKLAELKSVNDLTADQFKAVQNEAIKIGSTTVFGATKGVEAMTVLTKAGLSVEQTLQAIPGVVAAAATENLNLAQSADIVTNILQGQNLAFSDANRVADVLSYTANSTAAGMVDLGEAFRYANTLSKNLSFEKTAAALGFLSNAGLKGSIAGTSLVAMFAQLTKPSEKVQNTFKNLGLSMNVFLDPKTGKFKELPEILKIISAVQGQIVGENNQLAFLYDFVGQEGAKAFNAITRAVNQVDEAGKTAWDRALEVSKTGYAAQTAEKRLDSLTMAWERLKNGFDVAAITIGSTMLPGLRELANGLIDNVKTANDALSGLFVEPFQRSGDQMRALDSETGRFITGFITALTDGIKSAREFAGSISESLAAIIPQGDNAAGTFGNLSAKILMAATVAVPLALGFVALTTGTNLLIGGLSGVWTVISVLIPSVTTLRSVMTVLNTVTFAGTFVHGNFGVTLAALTAEFPLLSAAATGFTTVFRTLSAALLTNPFGLILFTIPMVVMGLLWLKDNWASVTTFMKVAIAGVGTAIAMAGAAIIDTVRLIFTPLTHVIGALAKLAGWDKGGEFIQSLGLIEGKFLTAKTAAAGFAEVTKQFNSPNTSLGGPTLDKRNVPPQLSLGPTTAFTPQQTALQTAAPLSALPGPQQPLAQQPTVNMLAATAPIAQQQVTLAQTQGNQAQTLQETTQQAADLNSQWAGLQSQLNALKQQQPNVNVTVEPTPVNAQITVPVTVDGREISRSVGQHMVNNAERQGIQTDPRQRNVTRSVGPTFTPALGQ